jgi:hypothetical protein
MDATLDVMRVLEEYGRWKAEIPTMYGLDSRGTGKLSEEIGDRLRRMGFRIPIILEIRDEHHIEENIYLIDSSDRIYVARVRWRCVILEAANGETLKEHYFETVEIKGGY